MQILPSGQVLPAGPAVAERRASGLVLAPFRGVRYARDRVSGLAEVTSPPYDVIASDTEGRLRAADPHNIVRLILPRNDDGQPGDRYRAAAQTLARWQRTGILARDPLPALYVYEQARPGRPASAAGAGASGASAAGASAAGASAAGASAAGASAAEAAILQRGLIGVVRLAAPQAGVVLPHEDVAAGPVTGRRQLMEATGANLEPIFLLYDGAADHRAAGHRAAGHRAAGHRAAGHRAASRIVDAVADGVTPLVETLTGDGIRHRMWAITEPATLAAIAADLGPRQALIADGHHRYAAYRQLRQRAHAAGAGSGPWDLGLALLVDSAAYPPRIAPIHRVIGGLGPAAAAGLAASAFRVAALPGGSADVPAALARLAAAGSSGPAFVVAGDGPAFLLTDPDPARLAAALPAGHSARWRGLAPVILQELLLREAWGIADDDPRVAIVHDDAAAAIAAAASAGTAVISCPVPAADVYAVAAAGERVPRKSTSFAPKPRTGLVIRTFADS